MSLRNFISLVSQSAKENWYSGGGVQLGSLGTAATNGLLCQSLVIMMMEKLVE
jgi:hypothetical protein